MCVVASALQGFWRGRCLSVAPYVRVTGSPPYIIYGFPLGDMQIEQRSSSFSVTCAFLQGYMSCCAIPKLWRQEDSTFRGCSTLRSFMMYGT